MEKFYRYLPVTFIILFQIFLNVPDLYSSEVEEGSKPETEEDTSGAKNVEVEKAFKLFELVQSENRFIEKMDSFYSVNLPVGISAKGPKNAENYSIIISDLIIRDGQPFLNAYMAFKIPGTTKKLAFKGTNIPFSFSGGIKGEAKLELVSDFEVDFTKNFTLKLNGSGATYVSFDCDGFKEMAVDAVLEFDSALFVPENPDGTQKAGKLSTSVKTRVADWNDLLISISIDPFQLRPLKGVGFTVTNAVLDLSDFSNASNITFPENYKTDYFADEDENIWRGFYIQEAEIRLPRYFKKKGNAADSTKTVSAADSTGTSDSAKTEDSDKDTRLKLFASGLFIDELGFTADIGAKNILTLEEGSIGGWAFSLDSFKINITTSQLASASFGGQIQVPAFKNKNIFNYSAQMGLDDSYAFQVSVADSLEMNLWMAQLKLEKNSALNIELKNGSFLPSLNLNGVLTINAPTDKKKPGTAKLAIAEIPFEGMMIKTESPYFSIEKISFGTKQNLFAKFPISIKEIKIGYEDGRIGLKLALLVNFTKENAGGFGGEGGFTVWAKRTETSWEYDGIDIDKISVDISKPGAFELKGSVLFIKGDSTYGDGFKGELEAKFAKFGMQATALFGNVNGFRYWYADALIETAAGIPAGPISIYGFGGGAYYNMEQTGVSSEEGSDIGKSSSGVIYVPSNSSALGILASVKLGTSGSKNAFNGDVKFEIAFTSTGGVDKIYFTGNGYFVTAKFETAGLMEKAKAFIGKNASGSIPKDGANAQMSANVKMVYDFQNNSFHCTFDLFINVANGVVVGSGDNDKAGSGVVHFDPDDWYIKLGTPESPNEIDVLKLATMKNYFMAGKTIPGIPAPPDNVLKALGSKINDYYKQRNSLDLADGSGFALGAKFSYSIGEKNYWIFYGKFDCGLGFDMLMKNYGSQSYCSNTGQLVGINGWYAEGQAYGWISANIGINVDLLFYKGRYSIFDAELAALLQAKAPNPFWMQGNVAGNYNILGGLVKGNFDFDFEIGEKCNLVAKDGNVLSGISMISAMSPDSGATNINVFRSAQAVFNMPVERQFEIIDDNNNTHIYRIMLKQFTVKKTDGTSIKGSLTWNSDHDVVAFKSFDILPGNTNLKAIAEVSFETKKSDGNWWAVMEDSKELTEKKEISFTTSNAPSNIPPENVAVSYPQIKQFNYYKLEPGNNFIKLDRGQPELFNPGPLWKQNAIISSISGTYSDTTTINYDAAEKQINFILSKDLPNNTIYKFQLINIPVAPAESAAKIKQSVSELKVGSSLLNIVSKQIESTINNLKEVELYKMEFRTSKFNTFTEKINSLSFSDWVSWEISSNIHSLTTNIYGERFDSYEIQNLVAGKQVSVSPVFDETKWYASVFVPSITINPLTKFFLGINDFKLPSNGIYIFQPDNTRTLTAEEILSGVANETDVNSGMKNYIEKYACEYYSYLQNKVAAIQSSPLIMLFINKETKAKFSQIIRTDFKALDNGNYPVNIYYTLPAGKLPNSQQKKNIEFTE